MESKHQDVTMKEKEENGGRVIYIDGILLKYERENTRTSSANELPSK